MELGRIGEDGSGVRCEILVDGNGRRQGGAQHLQGFLDNDCRLERDLFAFRLTAEGEDLFDQILGPMTGFDDLIKILRDRGTGRAVVPGQFRIAEDGPEDVVEIVGDAAGQGADGLHFLGLLQLRLEFFPFVFSLLALGDVGKDAGELIGRRPVSGNLEIFLEIAGGVFEKGRFTGDEPPGRSFRSSDSRYRA